MKAKPVIAAPKAQSMIISSIETKETRNKPKRHLLEEHNDITDNGKGYTQK